MKSIVSMAPEINPSPDRWGGSVGDIPGLSLTPDFITAAEEDFLVSEVDRGNWALDVGKRTQKFWDARSVRLPDIQTVLVNGLPDFTRGIAGRIVQAGLSSEFPYRLIVSDYRPGEGMAAHVDRKQGFKNRVLILSLLSAYPMEFRNGAGECRSLLLPPRSLLLLEGEARYEWAHGIPASLADEGRPRGRRISFAFSCLELPPGEERCRETGRRGDSTKFN